MRGHSDVTWKEGRLDAIVARDDVKTARTLRFLDTTYTDVPFVEVFAKLVTFSCR